jgi:hypothetical protein
VKYAGIGRGTKAPTPEFVDFVEKSFIAVERGTANEVKAMAEFLNGKYASSDFNKVSFDEVRRLGATCVTGCNIVAAAPVGAAPVYKGFRSHLANCAATAA